MPPPPRLTLLYHTLDFNSTLQVKMTGAQPLLSKEDLHTMFAMFDLTHRGAVTAEQANAALRSALGPSADLRDVGVEAGAILTLERFTSAMQQALQAAVPYQKKQLA